MDPKLSDLCEKQTALMKEYGTTLRFWLGPYLWINLAEPKHLEALMTSEYATNKDPTYQFFKDQANGIFIASGENWKKLRKLVNPTFNQKLLENFTECFNEQSKILVDVIEKKTDGSVFDIHDYVARCTLDILCGTQMNVNSTEQLDNTSNFAKHLLWSTEITKQRYIKLHLHPDILFHMTELSRQNMKHIHHLHKFVKGVIQKRKLARKEENIATDALIIGEKKRPVFLDSVLHHYNDLPEDKLVLKITDMFIAGSDTTAVAISYALMIMGIYKEIQEKVYKEVINVIGDNDDDITHLDLPKLPYLEMVLKEVLRHYTIPAVVRKLDKDQSIGDLTLPAGTSAQLCFYAVHRDPRFWKYPESFYPEHFLPEEILNRPKYSYVPFSMGPRNCPGYAFAMMSMKIVVAAVIRKYKIHSDVDLKTMEFNNVFMLEPKNGYPIQISKR
ncbi:cytochrome P450 4C1-like isoform X2 [Lycorma delicatula]|uniref:cytochrome P450 4C1-like isoform X2 n=1 Tax=Lycorma delicatula TaxID=130591 RepID=UPI003F5158DC